MRLACLAMKLVLLQGAWKRSAKLRGLIFKMANELMCWKKTKLETRPKSIDVYEHTDGGRLLFIGKSQVITGKPFRVGGVNRRGFVKDEYFKDLEDARKFANSHMKKRDKC